MWQLAIGRQNNLQVNSVSGSERKINLNSRGYRDLIVYQKAFDLAMNVYELTKEFPQEEKYMLTDQMRRSSRAVCANLAEAYRKRQYPAHFVSKLSDADAENSETIVWLEFAYALRYIADNAGQIGRMLNRMIEHPEKFVAKGLRQT